MDKESVCAPRLAETDAENNNVITPNVSSVTDADKVINIKISSAQTEGPNTFSPKIQCKHQHLLQSHVIFYCDTHGDQGEKEQLKGLLTDDYCHVCEAVLLFESQRLCHYEGNKHAQRLQLYLQSKKAEKMTGGTYSLQRAMPMDKDRFCELCNMVFSSPVVARSHYEGKVHAKNQRKHGFPPTDNLVIKASTDMPTHSGLTQASPNVDQKPTTEGGMAPQDPTVTPNPSTRVDLKDPDKYCALCPASFNNPQMALQHYNGRKHQRNQARQELLKELGEETQNANSLTCQMCSIQFNSVEMYQAHMQGNKHQIKEKKVLDLCKSQQKIYNSYSDELADYIQVQQARGIATKTSHTLGQSGGEEKVQEDGERVEEARVNQWDSVQHNTHRPNLPPIPGPTSAGSYYPAAGWCPLYRAPPANRSGKGAPYGWDYPPTPLLPGTGPTFPPHRPVARRRHREESSSSSSSYTSSSSSSSSSYSSSSASDSDDSQYRHRERKRRAKRKRNMQEEEDEEQRSRRKRPKTLRDGGPEERRRREEVSRSEERRRRRWQKYPDRRTREKAGVYWRGEGKEGEGEDRPSEDLNEEELSGTTGQTEGQVQTAVVVQKGQREQAKLPKPKPRKEKKKTKAKVQDSRTEEEKLWDESILGM